MIKDYCLCFINNGREKKYRTMKEKIKQKRSSIIKIFLLIAVIYLFMTPTGALRLSIAAHGYPSKALVYPIGKRKNSLEEEKNERVYALYKPPVEKDTEGILTNWSVKKYALFYLAMYRGDA